MTISDEWDKWERFKSHKIWSYFILIDIDKLFHTKSRWPRVIANMMFYSGIFHSVYILYYYISWLLYYMAVGDTSFP